MCPVCWTQVLLVAAAATTTGGLGAAIGDLIRKRREVNRAQ